MKSSIFTLLFALLFSATTFAQLTGIKTIPGDYPTVAAAIADLNTNGAGTGGVTFDVTAGHTETFATAVDGIITASGTEANPIVFQKSGAGNNPLITAGVGTTTNIDGIILITGGDYITFDGIDLMENAANADKTAKMEFGYALLKRSKTAPVDGCQYVTIKNCSVALNKGTSTSLTSNGIYSGNHIFNDIQSISFTESSEAVNNCKFYNNTISNVTYGIRILGGNVSLDLYDQNNEIGVDGENTITDFTYYGINSRYQRNIKVANNTIFTNALPITTLYGIYTQNTVGGSDVYSNSVTIQPSGGNFGFTGINLSIGEPGDTGNVYNNVVENCISPASTSYISFTGISNGSSGVTLNMYDNTVKNNVMAGTGGFTGLDSGSPGAMDMYHNTVSNNTKTGTSGTFVGIKAAGSGTSDCHDNFIFSNYDCTSAASNQGGTIYGIQGFNANQLNIYNNMIYDLSANGGNYAGSAFGVYIQSGTQVNVYNNYIYDIRATEANNGAGGNLVAGIQSATQPQVLNVYFNTIYLNTTSTGANFSSSALFVPINVMVEIRNNIFVNLSEPTGSGVTAAYRRAGVSLDNYSTSSNANVFYAGAVEDDTHTVFYHGGNTSVEPPIFPQTYTFEEFQAFVGPARESGSFRHLPPFVNTAAVPYDLHLIDGFPTPCESGGVQITSPIAITTDFDGDARSSAPDIGADEFTGVAISVINPGAVIAIAQSSHQIDVNFSTNPSDNDVVIVWSATGDFTAPAGDPPAPGEPFAGGTLLYSGKTAPASHINLPGAIEFFYKAFSYDGYSYSRGIVVSETTNIAPPADFTATAVSESQIDLVWTQNSYGNDVIIFANDWDNFGQPVNGVVYAPGSELPDGGTVIYVGPLSGFSHTGLIPNITAYYYKAWSYDPTNMDIYSQSGVSATAATLCSTNTIPFYESFEYNGELGCGSVVDANENFDTWIVNFGYAYDGVYSLRALGGSFASPKDDWYFTSGLDLTGGSAYEIKFWYRTRNTSGTPHQIEVKWGDANTAAGMTSSPVYYADVMTPTTSYTQITCALMIPETTGVYYVGIHDFSEFGPSHDFYMDYITINEIILPAAPTALTAVADLSTINLAYSLNDAGDDVIIATNSTNTFDQPQGGTTYQVGNVIGSNGTVIYQGSITGFAHTGLASNTTFYYKAWSVDGANNYSTTGVTADATTGDYQLICVPTGWSAISSYNTPQDLAIETVLSEISEQMQIILSNTGFYWPSQNINTIGNWDSHKGYKTKMNQAACFHVIGDMVGDKTINVAKGASYIPVLCDQPVIASDVFSQFGENLEFAYDLQTQSIYWPEGGFIQIDFLEPGVGYLVIMHQAGQATYACDDQPKLNYVKAHAKVFENAPWDYQQSGMQHFISINKSALAEVEKGNFIGVFTSENVCAGFTQYNGEDGNLLLVVNGNDITTDATDGLLEGENMSFRIYKPSQMSETRVTVTFAASMPNAGSFVENGRSMITKIGAGATAIGEYQLSDLKLYPNPGSGVFTLDVPALEQRVTVQVENSLGQLIYSEMIEANQTGSAHNINLSSAKSGLYFVKISYQDETIVSKLIVR
ncbi:MAG: T9SS type A sorting domain-containing protein [Clostridia bacterium]|nr:T9SS type A sorting domain-containing protein [Clostridia bacterium]